MPCKKRLFGARAHIEIAHKSWPPINFADTSLGKDIERQLSSSVAIIFLHRMFVEMWPWHSHKVDKVNMYASTDSVYLITLTIS